MSGCAGSGSWRTRRPSTAPTGTGTTAATSRSCGSPRTTRSGSAPRTVDIDDPDAIVEDEAGFVGAWLDPAEIEPHTEWPLPTERPALAQGSIAGVPAKLWLPDDGRAFLLTAAAYAHELETRLGWRS